MRWQASVASVAEAAATLEDERTTVTLCARAIATAAGRGIGAAYTFRSRPLATVGEAMGYRDGAPVPSSQFSKVHSRSWIAFNRAEVEPTQRNRWVDPLRDLDPSNRQRFLESPLYREFFKPLGVFEQARMLICQGGRALGFVGVTLPDGEPYFTRAEWLRLEEAAQALSAPMRVAALLAGAGDHVDALDALIASRTDAMFALSASGRVLAASPAGTQLLQSHPSLVQTLADAARRARRSGSRHQLGEPLGELQLTPCTRAGPRGAWLAVIGPHAQPARPLSRRQLELTQLLREGLSNKELAQRMQLSPATVKTMLERLYRAAGVSNRVALLRWLGDGGAREG